MKPFYLLLLFAGFISSLYAQQPGTVDSSFAKEGRVKDVIHDYDWSAGMIVQPDDKILVGGRGSRGRIRTFRVDRLLKDGSPDSSFGINGRAYIPVPSTQDPYKIIPQPTCMALLPDGKILAGARVHYDFVLARLLPDGTTDSSFGRDGIASRYPNRVIDVMALQPDGRILLAGKHGYSKCFLQRLLPDGTPDSSFGSNGEVIERDGSFWSLALQDDGKILAAGYSDSGTLNGKSQVLIERFDIHGNLDKTFSEDGVVDTAITNYSSDISDVAILPDGKIAASARSLLIDQAGDYIGHFNTFRFNPDGSLDKSFGGSGIVTQLFLDSAGNEVSAGASEILFVNNKIIVSGQKHTGLFAVNYEDLVLLSYNDDGTLDSNFAGKGISIINFEENESVINIALQSDGKIVLFAIGRTAPFHYPIRYVTRCFGYPQPLLITQKR